MNERIKGLADIFPRDSVLVDIGCDHGYLGIELLKQQKINLVINVDLSKDALKRSFQSYKRLGLERKSKFFYSNGFSNIEDLYDDSCVVIAGMGSTQILKILEKIPDNVKKMVLLSHTDYYPIRRWAWNNDWWISREKYVRDRKSGVYLIIYLVKSIRIPHSNMQDYIFGREEFRNNHMDMFIDYWRPRAYRIRKIPFEHRACIERMSLEFLEDNKYV